ncbi:LysR substrate-binding domain-containing protein [Loktanella salsilacus]|uniref:LysR substrate-binding domain-containing protein n=1 Tax=Loktanella salsilacus TaxID=195913 RepID=UPI0037356F6F
MVRRGAHGLPAADRPVFDSSVALAELAASGAGAALLPVIMFESWVAQSRLAQPFGITVSVGRYFLTWPSDRRVSPAMAAFAKWLLGKCAT